MNIQFDTKQITPDEALGLIALLETLLPVSEQVPDQSAVVAAPTPTTLHEQLKASVEQVSTGPVLVEPSAEATTKRTRRTKEQIAADEAARQQQPPTVGDQLAAAEAARKAEAAQPVNGATKIDADQLRALLNGYIARHSMEEAIEKLRAFGCNRVTEALALEAVKLNELAATLNG